MRSCFWFEHQWVAITGIAWHLWGNTNYFDSAELPDSLDKLFPPQRCVLILSFWHHVGLNNPVCYQMLGLAGGTGFQAQPPQSKGFAVNSSKANTPGFTAWAKKTPFQESAHWAEWIIFLTPPPLFFFLNFSLFFATTLAFLRERLNCRRVQPTLPAQSSACKCQPQLGVQPSVRGPVKLAGLSTTGMLTWQIWES